MSKQNIEVRDRFFVDGREIEIKIPTSSYSDSMISQWNKVTISGSASNETVAITDLGTVKRLDLKVATTDIDKITVKYNGSNKAYDVGAFPEITSENITSLTASNSSTSAVDLYWRAVYE